MRPVHKSLKEYGRGIIGGFLFSLPMLFTMEVWWAGNIISYYILVIYIVLILLLLLGYNRFAGMRHDASWGEVIVDSVEEMGLGFLLSFILLWIIGEIDFQQMHFAEIAGKLAMETTAVAIGISVGTAQLGSDEKEEDSGMGSNDNEKSKSRNDSLGHFITLSVCGGVLIAANIAPTEEVVIIGLNLAPVKAFLLVLLSILISTVIMFFIDFKGANGASANGVELIKVVQHTCLSYALALCVSGLLLALFGRFAGNNFAVSLYETIVLAVPAALGTSAGRLLLKS